MSTQSRNDEQPAKKRKYVSRACQACRRRRMKCDGTSPCRTCTIYKEECIFESRHDGRKPATKEYVDALVQRVRDLEEMLGERIDTPSRPSTPTTPDSIPSRIAGVSGVLRVENDSVTHHGPSSAYMLLPDSTERLRHELLPPDSFPDSSTSAVSPDLSMIAWNRHLPPSVIHTVAVHQEVLDIFFCYLNDWCRVIDEGRFLAGLHASVTSPSQLARNEYYSPLLHNAVLALAISRCPHLFRSTGQTFPPAMTTTRAAAAFAQRARWLFEEEASKPMISTAKGLLLLGSYHSVAGSLSLGWFYESLGVRMAQTMGLNADCTGLVARGVISQEMKDGRDRALWTVYAQDQLWALSVGRSPAITQDMFEISLPPIDALADATPWLSHVERQERRQQGSTSSTTLSWSGTTFHWTCRLFLLADKLHQALYRMKARQDERTQRNAVSQLHVDLAAWLYELPSPIRIDSSRSATPPHIIMMHAYHRYLQILLHRPGYTQPKAMGGAQREMAVQTSNTAAIEILHLVDRYQSSVGLQYASTGLISIVFASGTIHLLDLVQSQQATEQSLSRTRHCIQSLRQMSWPSALTGADVLEHMLEEWYPRPPVAQQSTESLVRLVNGGHSAVTGQPIDQHAAAESYAVNFGWLQPSARPDQPTLSPLFTLPTEPALWEDFGDMFDMADFQMAPFAMHDWGGMLGLPVDSEPI